MRRKRVRLLNRREVREIATIIIMETTIIKEEEEEEEVAGVIVSISYNKVLYYILLKGVRQLIDLLKGRYKRSYGRLSPYIQNYL